MKKILLTTAFTLISTVIYSQTYYFKNRKESIKYTDSQGKTQYKVISNETNNYKFYFELSADGKNKQLFTVYINGSEAYWAAELKNYGYKEIGNQIFKHSYYYNTTSKENLNVFIADDYTKIIVMSFDGMAEYY